MKIKWWYFGLLFCLGLALLAPLASSLPDGLESVASNIGFMDKAVEAPFQVAPDYAFPFVQNETLATVLSGLGGTLIIFGLTFSLARLLRRRKAA